MDGREYRPVEEVLVCSSDAQEAESLGHWLSHDGYQVDLAEDPLTAVEKLTTRSFHVIIVIVRARERRWIDSIRVFNRLLPDLPVVVVAEGDSLETERLVRQGKIFYLLSKPISMAEVRAVLRDATGKVGAP
ncbi:MAG: response regulator [Acidobacteria bacterium]|nr:MAG: response regulator [Acidobacteriota bacterium]